MFGQEILNFIEFIPRKTDGHSILFQRKNYEDLDNNNNNTDMGRVLAKSRGFRFKTV